MRRILLAVALLALAARAAQLVAGGAAGIYAPTALDSAFYARDARALRAGEPSEPRPYLMSPLYPLLLAPFAGEAGLHVTAARAFQGLLGVGTAVLVAGVAGLLAGPAAAALGGAVAALYGPLLHYESGILLASVQGFFLIAGVALWLGALGRTAEPGPRRGRGRVGRGDLWAAAAGLALGLASALRPTALFVLGGLALWELGAALRRGAMRAALRPVAGLALGALLAVAPFTIRNLVVSGEPVLVTAAGGLNFWVGNHAGANGLWEPPPGFDFDHDPVGRDLAERSSGRSLSDAQASAWWRNRALADIAAHPAGWLRLLVVKSLLLLHPVEIPHLGLGFAHARERLWTLRLPLDAREILLLAALAPLLVGRAGPPEAARRAARVGAAALAYGFAVVLFLVTARYRIPLIPLAIPLAAACVVDAVRLARQRHAWAAAAPVLALAVSVPVFGGPHPLISVPATSGVEPRLEAQRLADAGHYLEAVAAYRSALEKADDPITRVGLGNALAALQRYPQAVAEYRRAIDADPTDPVAWIDLGSVQLDGLARPEEARASFARAAALRPDDGLSQLGLGRALLALDRPAEAAEALARAVERLPSGPEQRRARTALAVAQRRAGG